MRCLIKNSLSHLFSFVLLSCCLVVSVVGWLAGWLVVSLISDISQEKVDKLTLTLERPFLQVLLNLCFANLVSAIFIKSISIIHNGLTQNIQYFFFIICSIARSHYHWSTIFSKVCLFPFVRVRYGYNIFQNYLKFA